MKPIHLEPTCLTCGKPIVYSDEHGMFCEDRCGYAESVAYAQQFDQTVSGLMEFFTKQQDPPCNESK